MLSSSSIVSSCVDQNQIRSASISSTSTNVDTQNIAPNKLAPNLIDLIPPPPSYPPPAHTDGLSGMPVVSFSVKPSISDLKSTGMFLG